MQTKTDLDTRLTQYDATCRGEAARGRRPVELAGYAAAAGAGLAMAGTADAAIVYSGVQNISVSIDPAAQATNATTTFGVSNNTLIDIDGGGDDVDFIAAMTALLGGASDAKYYGGAAASAINGAAFLGTGNFGGFNFSASDTIAPGGPLVSSAGRIRSNVITGGVTTNNATFGNFLPGSTGFLGIQLASGNVGWIRLRIDDLGPNQPYDTLTGGNPIGDGLNYADQITVIDWAYEDSGAPIHVGSTSSVPEPTPLALLAAGAVGIGAFRRRQTANQTARQAS